MISRIAEPEWAKEARRAALRVFEETPWPTRNTEGWRRTDVTGIPFEEILATWIPSSEEVAATELPDGVILTTLKRALVEHPDLVRERYLQFPDDEVERKFLALARAFWTDGIFLYVPAGVQVSEPIHLKAGFGDSRLFCPRLLAIVAAGSHVTILDEHQSPDYSDSRFTCGVTDLFLGDGADVRYVHLNRWGSGVNNFHHIRSEIGRDAKMTSLQLGLGGSLTKATNEAVLIAPGAQSDMLGLAFGSGDRHFEHHTMQHHVSGKTTSDILFKVAVGGNARSVYTGMIRIDKDAQQASAYQSNQNILLSPTAHADTVPNLEILANDVRCTHGATVAPLDEAQVFYAMARGIELMEAKRLIVEGFLDQVLDRAALGALDDYTRTTAGEALQKELLGA